MPVISMQGSVTFAILSAFPSRKNCMRIRKYKTKKIEYFNREKDCICQLDW